MPSLRNPLALAPKLETTRPFTGQMKPRLLAAGGWGTSGSGSFRRARGKELLAVFVRPVSPPLTPGLATGRAAGRVKGLGRISFWPLWIV